jgi:hypothetical protein
MGIWFQGDHCRGKTTHAQFSSVQRMIGLFFPERHPAPTKDMLPLHKSKIFTLSLQLSNSPLPCFLGTICCYVGDFPQN